jgi:hypothetical protein
MRRGLTLLLVAAQVLALGWASLEDELPAAPAALWRVASLPRGATASQPREIRARSAYAVNAQNALWPRMAVPRAAAAFNRRLERFTCVPPLSRPDWIPQTHLVLRI